MEQRRRACQHLGHGGGAWGRWAWVGYRELGASVAGAREAPAPSPSVPVVGGPPDQGAVEFQVQAVTDVIELIKEELTQLEEVLQRLLESTGGE